MNNSLDQTAREILSGQRRGAAAAMMRGGLALIEPAYIALTTGRNALFNVGVLRAGRLPRPVLSVGNITTGGTGKTPVVRWLAEAMQDAGRCVGILARGYKSAPGQLGDEQAMLSRLLDRPDRPAAHIRANPRRFEAGVSLLAAHPEIDLFLLDDGFQHRRVARDLDIVLLSAVEPFGYGHVLPRGLLRERPAGLRRAGAIILTHFDQVSTARAEEIEHTVCQLNDLAPIYRASHRLSRMLNMRDEALPPERLSGRRWYAFCGIGSPDVFFGQLKALGGRCAGRRALRDHQDYSIQQIATLAAEAAAAGADVLVTTEKDWVKIASLTAKSSLSLPIWRADVALQFAPGDAKRLLAQVDGMLSIR